MSLPNYDSVKQKIIDTLVGRPEGTEIDPANQQNYELSLLDYVKSVETSSQTPFKGIADENTVPLQPNSSFISYISSLNPGQTKTFQNFRNQSGQPISVTADNDKSCLVILVWNTQYWSVDKITIAVKENGGSDYTLPVATSSVLGGVKIGETLKMNGGVLDVKSNLADELVKNAFTQAGINYNNSIDDEKELEAVNYFLSYEGKDKVSLALRYLVRLFTQSLNNYSGGMIQPLSNEAAAETAQIKGEEAADA